MLTTFFCFFAPLRCSTFLTPGHRRRGMGGNVKRVFVRGETRGKEGSAIGKKLHVWASDSRDWETRMINERERKKHLDIRGWLGNGEDVDGLKSLKCWLYFILFWQGMDAMWSGAYIFPALYALGTVEPGKSWFRTQIESDLFTMNTQQSLLNMTIEIFKKKGERGKEMPVYDTYCHLPLPPLQPLATDWKARTGFLRLHPVFSSQYINVPHQSSHIFI